MAWSAPMTAVTNATFTAAQFNTYVRDNLLETAPAKATTSGSLFVGSAANSIVERYPNSASVTGSETTASTTYVGLTTPCVVSVVTGSTALVAHGARLANNTAGVSSYATFAVSGASAMAASDTYAITYCSEVANRVGAMGRVTLVTGLTPGTNIFTAMYKAQANTMTAALRDISVLPL